MRIFSLLVVGLCAYKATAGGVDDEATGVPSALKRDRSTTVGAMSGSYWCENTEEKLAIGNGGMEFTDSTKACMTGTHQSPIALVTADAVTATTPLVPDFKWKRTNYSVEGTAHGPRMDFCLSSGGPCVQTTVFNGRKLTLQQWHAHAPSEHTLDGKYFDAELHFVHKHVPSGEIYVFGVFVTITKGGFSPVFDALLKNSVDIEEGEVRMTNDPPKVKILDLLPGLRANALRPYFQYEGSLTTSPCTEGVHWHVFADPVTIDAYQWRDYLRAVAATPEIPPNFSFFPNNRETQALNGRAVYKQGFP